MTLVAPQAETFGTTLRRLRDEHGLTADDLAQLVREAGERVSVQSITAWERGEYGPGNRQVVQTIDDCLNADGTLVAFMRGTPKPTRVAVATQLLAAGYDTATVAKSLGHSQAMTLNRYAHLVEQRARDAADHMGRLLTAPSEE